MKGNKGITLIALIITIIVLLILATVSVNLIMNDNIFKHANNAVTLYNEAQTNEQAKLDEVLEQMDTYAGDEKTPWWYLSSEEFDRAEEFGDGCSKFLVFNSNHEYGVPAILGCYDDTLNNEIVAIAVMTKAGGYIYCTDNMYKSDYSDKDDVKETNKWYTWGGSGVRTDDLYEGPCPISKEELSSLTKYVSDEWLEGFVNSFNNN